MFSNIIGALFASFALGAAGSARSCSGVFRLPPVAYNDVLLVVALFAIAFYELSMFLRVTMLAKRGLSSSLAGQVGIGSLHSLSTRTCWLTSNADISG